MSIGVDMLDPKPGDVVTATRLLLQRWMPEHPGKFPAFKVTTNGNVMSLEVSAMDEPMASILYRAD